MNIFQSSKSFKQAFWGATLLSVVIASINNGNKHINNPKIFNKIIPQNLKVSDLCHSSLFTKTNETPVIWNPKNLTITSNIVLK